MDDHRERPKPTSAQIQMVRAPQTLHHQPHTQHIHIRLQCGVAHNAQTLQPKCERAGRAHVSRLFLVVRRVLAFLPRENHRGRACLLLSDFVLVFNRPLVSPLGAVT